MIKDSLLTIESRATEIIQQNRYVIDQMDVDLLTSKLAALSLDTRHFKKVDDILKILDYEQRPMRHEAIPLAHQETFEWAFLQPEGSEPVSQGYSQGEGDFSRWLQEGDETFWISGKPGCGKSTLMKFLADHTEMRFFLDNSSWAGSSKVVVASHYFWSAGTAIQRSQQGLWRSLLFEILRQDPHIISQVCSQRYGSAEAGSRRRPWSLRELSDCVQNLAGQETPGTTFCFFVDGLDEFEGDALDLIKPLQALSKSRWVKLCVSSRPWNAFEQAFGHRSDLKIYVHDLTRRDIHAFASERLNSHPNWDASAFEGQDVSIAKDITERSDGVFLWVFVVTRELREGLTNFDTVADLERRLHRMPTELGPFFMHILDSVDSFYHGRMAETLRISFAADEVKDGSSLPFSIYHFHDKEYDDPGFALRLPTQPKFEAQTGVNLRQRVHYRLNGICKGLLELNGDFVGYVHRTVRDWLRDSEMQQYLRKKSAPTFNPYESILLAYLAGIKSTTSTEALLVTQKDLSCMWDGKLNRCLREAFTYVAYAESAGSCSTQIFEVIDCLRNTTDDLLTDNGSEISPWRGAWSQAARNSTVVFKQHLLEVQLWHYLARKLQINPEFFDQYPTTPFYDILKAECPVLMPHPRMVWTEQAAESTYRVLTDKQTVVSSCADDCACAVRVIWTLLVRDCLPENMLNVEAKPTDENMISFYSALQVGIMSRLASRLQLSREISVAQTSLGSVPAWFGLILAVLKTEQLSQKHRDEFLQILDVILRSSTVDFCCLANNTEDNGTTLWDVLCRHVHHHQESMNPNGTQEEFLAGIMSLVLVNAERHWMASDQTAPPRRLLESTISNCFSQKFEKYLHSILDPGEDSAPVGNTRNKKKREEPDGDTGYSLRKREKRL